MGERGWTTEELRALLRKKYAAPEYALFEEVRNGTGFSRSVTRSADALAYSLWPSRGLELHGFELKISRSDWQRELLKPAKAEALQQFCDRWWVVAPVDLVQPGELPVPGAEARRDHRRARSAPEPRGMRGGGLSCACSSRSGALTC